MTRGIKRKLQRARAAARAEIAMNAQGQGRFASGLSSEGFAGGYLAAIDDVLAMLGGYQGNSRYAHKWATPADSATEILRAHDSFIRGMHKPADSEESPQ